MPHNVQRNNHHTVDLREGFCVFINSPLAPRKFCNRAPDNNVSAKIIWMNDITQGDVFCYLVFQRKSASFDQIIV